MTPEEHLHTAMQTLNACRRIVVCEPDQADRIRQAVSDLDMAGLWTVRPSVICPPGKILLLNEEAIRNAIAVGYHNGPGIIVYPPHTKE